MPLYLHFTWVIKRKHSLSPVRALNACLFVTRKIRLPMVEREIEKKKRKTEEEVEERTVLQTRASDSYIIAQDKCADYSLGNYIRSDKSVCERNSVYRKRLICLPSVNPSNNPLSSCKETQSQHRLGNVSQYRDHE